MARVAVWHPTSSTTIEASFGFWGGKKVVLDGKELDLSWPNDRAELPLSDGRTAVLAVIKSFGAPPMYELRVEGHLVPPSVTSVDCPSCKAPAQPADARCGQCGAAIPDATIAISTAHVETATKILYVMAGLFVLGGLLFFAIGKGQADEALTMLAPYSESEMWQMEDGSTIPVGELRAQIKAETYAPLVINLVLAVIFVGLGLWSRRAALPALLTAATIYAAVIVISAIADPTTIAQGIIMKIIIIGALARGIQAASAAKKQA